ncbi:sulfatase-like hydrolase/transferase [Helicobacter suis]|uniref:sulfatase-like hydrolase/transferase n=1 Tax=Helicobacter suis TaxID=104628 RepID=UPI001F084D5A|nr:sulfatase-like hydrolase/transferase [Helicobacter suis]
MLFFTWSFTHAKQWLFLDKHAEYIGGLTLPYSYSINLIRAAFNSLNTSPPKLFSNAKAQSKNQVVVLVIGESARRANYGIYGYNRPTTPKLQARLNSHEILALKATSCATYTTAALECMLSSKKGYENLPSFLHRQGVSVVLLSLNNAEPPMRIDWHPKEYKWQEWLHSLGVPPPFNFDEALAKSLPFLLKRYENNLLVILHLKGSHGPLYVDKVPPNFAPFKPICTRKEPHTCSLPSLINAYDNTIAYNDFVLDLLIQELEQSKRPALLLYMSDHGESLGEHGMYLHGTPFLIAPDFQKQIPFIIFTHGFKPSHLPSDQISYTQDMIFSSILNAFGMQKSNAYNPACDLFK